MENPFSFDRFLEFPREEAYNRYKDEKNLKALRVLLTIFLSILGFASVIDASDLEVEYTFYFYLGIFFIVLFIRIYYNKILNVENIRRRFFVFFLSLLIIFLLINIFGSFTSKPVVEISAAKEKKKEIVKDESKGGISFSIAGQEKKNSTINIIFFFSIALLFLKLSRTEYIQLYVLVFGLPVLTDIIVYGNFNAENLIASTLFSGASLIISYTAEEKRKTRFNSQYDIYQKRHSETVRMKKELDYAREMQLSMLPDANTKLNGIRIAATSLPANEVGGDYYDYFKISDKLTGIFICDVSGHGVASGLLLSGLRSCIHLILEDTTNPKEVFNKLNRMIRKTQSRKMFVTSVFAVIDNSNETCTLYNAGHLPPYKISGESNELFKVRRHGITLGAVDNLSETSDEGEVTLDFKKNDKIVLYSDGITEAMNVNREEYGFERLELFLTHNADKNPEELLNGIINDVNNFRGNSELIDDISLIIVEKN